MLVEKRIKELKLEVPKFQLTSRGALDYKEIVVEAQAYLLLVKQLYGSENRFKWGKLKQVWTCSEELMTNAASSLIKTVSLPVDDEPMAQLTWKEFMATKIKDFELAKTLFTFVVEKLRLTEDSDTDI